MSRGYRGYKEIKYKKVDLSHMPYISDKDTFKAVIFARRLIGVGMPIGLANYKAAKYYGLDVNQVARYMGKLASNTREEYTENDAWFDDEQWKKKKLLCGKQSWNV